MKICVVGSGGREHALAHTLSPHADVLVTPGSPGIKGSTEVTATEIEADLYVVGPEIPLVEGLADDLRSRGCHVFGPGSDGAMLEGSNMDEGACGRSWSPHGPLRVFRSRRS